MLYAATTAGRSWPGQVIEVDERAAAGAERTWVCQLDRPSAVNPLRGAAAELSARRSTKTRR